MWWSLLVGLGCGSPPASDAAEDSGDPGDSGAPDGVRPPPWFADAARFTVPDARGWEWRRDDSFVIADASVPQVFVGPDGRYGMLATDNSISPRVTGRVLHGSDDGVAWSDDGVLFDAADFGEQASERLVDAALVPRSDGWTFLVEGITGDGGYIERSFWVARSTDFSTWDLDPEPLRTTAEGIVHASVPSAFATETETVLWVNSFDARGVTGVKDLGVDPASLAIVGRAGAGGLWPPDLVDPLPVYLEGGGARMYLANIDPGAAGIYLAELGPALAPVGDPTPVIVPEGADGCDTMLMDPALLQLPDGRLLLYATESIDCGAASVQLRIVRYVAAD